MARLNRWYVERWLRPHFDALGPGADVRGPRAVEVIGPNIRVGSHVFNGFLHHVVGEELGQLTGFGYRRDEQGRQVFGANGVPLRSEELLYFGSALPKWVGGITNVINFQGIQFSGFGLDGYRMGIDAMLTRLK